MIGPICRRSLIKGAVALPVLGLIGWGNRGSATSQVRGARMFFSEAEWRFVEAATQRLIPDEDDGLGAGGAHVAAFIDRQLAGPYGQATRWYMHGPWENGTEQQGYQLKLTPGELYQSAIRDIGDWCRKVHRKTFVELSVATQDNVLHGLEGGTIELAEAPSKTFFTMLWNNTVEGFLADPMYGGNYQFVGWKLLGFPGTRYNYVSEIERYGTPYTMPTVGILGRDGTLIRRD